MAKGLKLNREQYKRVKRMDHKQMEDFICNMYNEGYADGKAAAEPRIKPSDIATVLVEIKGVGTKKAAEIMTAVNKLYERGVKAMMLYEQVKKREKEACGGELRQ